MHSRRGVELKSGNYTPLLLTEEIETVNFDYIKNLIAQKNTFVLTTHVNPDGDGLGSEIALAHFLKKRGKQVHILNHSATPKNYEFLDEENEILKFEPDRDAEKILHADVMFIVDTNQANRLRSLEPFVLKSRAMKIYIDHHLDKDDFADYSLIDEPATATGEIVYHLLTSLDPKAIDKKTAQALYTAIMTDTGSFRFPKTDPEIHRIAAHLIECGADPVEIYQHVYESWTAGRFRLLGKTLDGIQLAYGGKLAYLTVTQKMLKETETTEVETDNFVTYAMGIHGVVMALLFIELPNGIKISFRSKGDIPANELAKEFGGNGHLNAAGARLFNVTLDETAPKVIEKAGIYLKEPVALG